MLIEHSLIFFASPSTLWAIDCSVGISCGHTGHTTSTGSILLIPSKVEVMPPHMCCGQAQGQWHCNQGSNTSTYLHVIFLWLRQYIILINKELGDIFLQGFELSKDKEGHNDGQERCLNWT